MKRRAADLLAIMNLPESTNRRQLEAAHRWLRIAMDKELTSRQRECLLLYFRDRLTMQEIGLRLGLTKGTVCKHLRKASDRLRRAAKYAPLFGDRT